MTAADLDFLVSTAAPETRDKARLKQILQEDEDFRNAFLEDEEIVRRVVADRKAFLKISPRLYFEILLRKARKELMGASHTIEYGSGARKVTVFDAGKVVDLLSRQEILRYLAEMLSSFTRVQSYSIAYRIREGVWGRIRFHDADVDSLLHLMEFAGEEFRIHFYKRIADIYLFTLGVFPEYVQLTFRYPYTGKSRPPFIGTAKRSMEEYEEEGRKFYRLAAEHPMAQGLALAEVFHTLHDSFHVARKPLNFIAENYISQDRRRLFDPGEDG